MELETANRYLYRRTIESRMEATLLHLTAGAPLLRVLVPRAPPLSKIQMMCHVVVAKKRMTAKIAKGTHGAKKQRAMSLSVCGYGQIVQVRNLPKRKENGWSMAGGR
jgi:hypothetical protein